MSAPGIDDAVLVVAHRRSAPAADGGKQHEYDVVNFPGIKVIARNDGSGVELWRNYHFAGTAYSSDREAVAAWMRAQSNPERDVIDYLAEALRRLTRGLVRPLWHDMTPKQKSSWLGTANLFIRLLASFGLRIVRIGKEPPP